MIGRGVKHAGKACAREEKEAVGVRKERRVCVESSGREGAETGGGEGESV